MRVESQFCKSDSSLPLLSSPRCFLSVEILLSAPPKSPRLALHFSEQRTAISEQYPMTNQFSLFRVTDESVDVWIVTLSFSVATAKSALVIDLRRIDVPVRSLCSCYLPNRTIKRRTRAARTGLHGSCRSIASFPSRFRFLSSWEHRWVCLKIGGYIGSRSTTHRTDSEISATESWW